ncbi:MAG: patatin-like phospholipase family protein [Reichenbachiella sp.]
MKLTFYKVVIFALLSLTTQQIYAQKVALVLSGGGAKGIAHAGVIQALEENGIPIDYVVGTSMGSIVGAFYAAGYSADQISELAKSKTMRDWINGELEEDQVNSYLEKPVIPKWFAIKLVVDSSFHTVLDPSIDGDYSLNINLAEQFYNASKIADGSFDNLMVPYRAIASDIFREKTIILDSGNLYESARASMAIPFIYRPVRVNNKLIFDGGIFNNFPVDIAREEFNPDVIIGVNVGDKKSNDYPYEEDEAKITESVLFLLLNKADPTMLEDQDVFIDVDVSNYHSLEFEKSEKIYELGYEAGINKMGEIKAKIKRQYPSDSLILDREKFKPFDLNFDTIIIEGFNEKASDYILDAFEDKSAITFSSFKKGYFNLISDDYFLSLFPSFSFENSNALVLKGDQKSKIKSNIGGSITSRHISYFYVNLRLKHLTNILQTYSTTLYLGRFYQSALASANFKLPGFRNTSIEAGITYNRWDYLSAEDYLLDDPQLTPLDRKDSNIKLLYGVPLSRRYAIKSGVSYLKTHDKLNNSNTSASASSVDNFKLEGWRLISFLYHNSLNTDKYPKKGSYLKTSFNYFLLNEDLEINTDSTSSHSYNALQWWNIKSQAKKYWSINDSYSLGLSGEAVFSNQPIMGDFISSQVNLPAYYPYQDSHSLFLENFRSRNYMAMGIVNVFTLNKSFQLRLEGNVFNPAEVLVSEENPYYDLRWWDPKFAASGSLVYTTMLGPVSLHVNYYQQEDRDWGAFLQFGYLVFNDHSLD